MNEDFEIFEAIEFIGGSNRRSVSQYNWELVFEELEKQAEQLAKEGKKGVPFLTTREIQNLIGAKHNAYVNQKLVKLIAEERLVKGYHKGLRKVIYTAPKYLPEKIRKQAIADSLESILHRSNISKDERERLIRRINELRNSK